MVGFEIEWWLASVERFEGAPAALVRSKVKYNGAAEPSPFRTIWMLLNGSWHTTAVGKLGHAEPGAAPDRGGM